LEDSKKEIESRLGNKAVTFAFPYGTSSHWSPALASLAQSVGFRGVVCAESGFVDRASDPFWLPRISPARSLSEATWHICRTLQRRSTASSMQFHQRVSR
jgi:hypothetical protein